MARTCCFFAALILAILIANISTVLATNDVLPNTRKEKLFIVQIQNTPCQAGSANGTCYLKAQCIRNGGEVAGTCQNGLGSCCKFNLGCSNVSNYKTITEREFTIKDNKDCEYEIIKLPGYCQLKLEVSSLYSGATTDGTCAGAMTIEDSVTVDNFLICGSVKRPLYASYGQGQRITLSFASGGGEGSNNYEVKVTHVRCDARERVPDHCLVEYSGRTGKVENFGDSGWIAGQKYNVCIRKSGTSIRWVKCDHSLTLYGKDPALLNPIPSKDFILSKIWGRLGASGDSCKEGTSYVSIQGNRFCGNHFPDLPEVTSVDEPFTLGVSMKRDDFSRIPKKLVVWPPFIDNSLVPPATALPADTCKGVTLAEFDKGTIVDVAMCVPIASGTTLASFFNQCACIPQLVAPTTDQLDALASPVLAGEMKSLENIKMGLEVVVNADRELAATAL